ncbi:MAG: glycerophosphodiester phosphodiesterase family protein [Planctomycetota bacterium]
MDLYADLDLEGASGVGLSGPPWLLGHRGAPREAPENTLASLRRALSVGLDGVEYDVRACRGGDLVLMHDATLERTTDHSGPLSARSVPELFGIDAGGWFAKRFTGEAVPLLDEALELAPESRRVRPIHMIELKEAGLERELLERLTPYLDRITVRVACFRRDVCLAVRDVGLPAMLLGVHANEDDMRFVRDERLAAYSVGPGGWDTEAGRGDWSFCERWSWAIDDPNELLRLARQPVFGLNSNEPWRALAARALAQLAPDDEGPWPLRVPDLFIEPESLDDATRARGEWFGRWQSAVSFRNPFPVPVEVRAGLFVPHGAFEVDGLPTVFDLAPGATRTVDFSLAGGSRAPGPDPLVGALYTFRAATFQRDRAGAELTPGRKLLFDAPLSRRRVVTADGLAQRLTLLPERPDDAPASVTMRRTGRDVVLSLERAGGLTSPHLIARLGGDVVRGGTGLRLPLPADFDSRPVGVPFSAGIEGRGPDGPRVRRWSGGLPEGIHHGTPGLLLPMGRG